MSTKPEQPDDLPNDADEAQVAWLLTSACSAPAMREEFTRELSAKLRAEFDAEFGVANDRHVLNGYAANGHATNGQATNGHVDATVISKRSHASLLRWRRRGRLRGGDGWSASRRRLRCWWR